MGIYRLLDRVAKIEFYLLLYFCNIINNFPIDFSAKQPSREVYKIGRERDIATIITTHITFNQ